MTLILVTGAAGFIGSHLCESLVRRGCGVRGVDAFTPFYDPAVKHRNLSTLHGEPAFELVKTNLLTADLSGLLDGADAIVHLAGEPGVSMSWGVSFERYLSLNVLATQRLLEAAVDRQVQRFVYASSSSVYGAAAGAYREGSEPRPASPYGASKLAAETLVGAYAYSRGLPSVSLRYFSVYGPRQRPDMAAHRFIEAMLDGGPVTVFGDGGQVRDFTYVGDVVDATVKAVFAELPPATVLDVASAQPTSVSTLVSLLQQLLDSPPAACEQQSERPGDVPRTEGDIVAARRYLSWEPTTDLRTGLSRQVAWHNALRGEGPTSSLSRGLIPAQGGVTPDTATLASSAGVWPW